MKISCSLSDEIFDRIEPHIDCRDWGNPMEDLFVFYDPTEQFLVTLALFDITFYREE
jgi:hypothetical protein